MEKGCCDIRVTETEEGFKVEVKGEGLKERCRAILKNLCSADLKNKGFQFCCGSGK